MRQMCHKLRGRHDGFVRRDLEDAVRGGIHDQLAGARRAPAPSSSMIAVPDAGLLPITCKPVSRLKGLDNLRREAVGIGRERAAAGVRPAISQWPVVVSLPAARSVHHVRSSQGSLFFHVLIPRRGQQPQILQIGQVGMLGFKHMAKGIRTLVAQYFPAVRPASRPPVRRLPENDNAFHLFHTLPSMRVSSASCAIISPQVGFPRWASMVF